MLRAAWRACRVVRNPNSLFYCGDTCQTIARGVGFRFTDIRTLFWEESLRRKVFPSPLLVLSACMHACMQLCARLASPGMCKHLH